MKKSKSSFRGKTRKNADARKRGSSFSYLKLPEGVEVFKPEPDTRVDMDIMPYTVTDKKHPDRDPDLEIATPGTLWYKRPFKTHRSIGAEPRSYVCPTTFGKKCPICEYREKLRKSDGDDAEIKALGTSDRNLYAIIVHDKKKGGKNKLYLFDISDFLFQEKFEEQLSDDEKFETFPDHTEGFTLRVRFVENSFAGNKFPEPSRFDFVDRVEQYTDKILDKIPNLDECLEVLSYEDLKAKFLETVAEDDDDDDEDEKPKSKRNVKSKPVKDDDDDDEEEDDEDEDDDTEEDTDTDEDADEDADDDDDQEEDDDDEDEDDEEPEPAPVRKRKSKVPEKPAKTSKKELTCPFDHKFGKDTNKYDDCDDCEVWNECYAKKKAK